eukprot:428827_1
MASVLFTFNPLKHAQGDLDLVLVLCCCYLLFLLLPVLFSMNFVRTQSFSTHEELTFYRKWYNWNNQYVYYEAMFRLHVLIVLSLIVVSIFETEWPVWVPCAVIASVLLISICLKLLSNTIQTRVIPKERQRYFNKLLDEQSFREQTENAHAVKQPKKRWSFNKHKSYKDDKKVPLLSGHDHDSHPSHAPIELIPIS